VRVDDVREREREIERARLFPSVRTCVRACVRETSRGAVRGEESAFRRHDRERRSTALCIVVRRGEGEGRGTKGERGSARRGAAVAQGSEIEI